MSEIFNKLVNNGIVLPSSQEDPRTTCQLNQERELSLTYLNKPFYKYLFSKHNILLEKTRAIPAGDIMRRIEIYAAPLFSQFFDKTDNEVWSEIQDRFFKYAFWNNHIYISYEPYSVLLEAVDEKNEDLIAAIKDLDDNQPHLQMWVRDSDDLEIYDRTITFTHLRTGLTLEVPNWREEMIMFEWCGYDVNRFEQWWEFGFNECRDRELINLAKHLTLKVAEFHYDPNRKTLASTKAFTSSIYNMEPVYVMEEGESITYLPLLKAQEYQQYQLGVFAYRDRELSTLGLVANTNPKGDRLTTNENYKDIIGVAWRQNATLRNLIKLSKKMSEKWGIKTEFVVCGIAERVPLPTDPKQQNMQQRSNWVAIR